LTTLNLKRKKLKNNQHMSHGWYIILFLLDESKDEVYYSYINFMIEAYHELLSNSLFSLKVT